mgnify:CR=1 FL=1
MTRTQVLRTRDQFPDVRRPSDHIFARKEHELRMWQFARLFCSDGARPRHLNAITGLPIERMRDLWMEIHGDRPHRGPPPRYARSLIHNMRHASHASIFIEVFRSVTGVPAEKIDKIDLDELYRVHRIYEALLPGEEPSLPIWVCWYILRDLRQEVLRIQYCCTCHTHYVEYLEQNSLRQCPHCYCIGAKRSLAPREI